MDSDIDAEVPQRLKSPSKSPSYRSSPFRSSPIKATARLSSPGNRPSNPNSPQHGPTPPDDSTYNPNINSALYVRSSILSPVSNYSSKSIKDSLDVSKIRSLLSRLQAQLVEEKKTNEELSEQHNLEIKRLKAKYEAKLKQSYSEWNGHVQTKYKEINKKKDNEIAKLYEQISRITSIEESESISKLIKQIEDLLIKLNNGEEQNIAKIDELVTLLKAHIKKMQDSQAQSEVKLERQKSHINELTNIIRMLDSKLKNQPNKSDSNDGLEQTNTSLMDPDIQELLRISSSERLQLEKQIIWLKGVVEKSDGELSKDFKNRAGKIEKLEEELRVSQEKEKSFVKQISQLEQKDPPEPDTNMEKLLKSDNSNAIDGNSESLQEKVTELEKLCKQQQLNYEEALLELETMKKSNLRNSSLEHNDLGTNPISSSYDQLSGKIHSNARIQDDTSNSLNNRVSQIQFNNAQETHINNSSTDSAKSFPSKNTTPAPTNIRVEIQKNNYLVKWTSPVVNSSSRSMDTELTGYHVYLDGHFYKFVGIIEPSCVAIPFPSRHHHQTQQRVSIRSVGVNSQSKDGECTILLPHPRAPSGPSSSAPPGSYIPTELKATRITSDSARISWLPADSNLPHVVWVNGTKYGNVSPGDYKTDLEGLFPNTLQKISVFPVLDRFGDNSLHAANIDFQTLPVFSESSANLSKNPQEDLHPPKDVKLKLGSRSGKFVVKWQCPTPPSSDNLRIIGYSLFISNQCVCSVNGAKVDRLSVSLSDLRGLSLPSYTPKYAGDQPHLTLTVRTVALYTPATAMTAPSHSQPSQMGEFRITSKDSMPLLRFSGHVAARIAGTAAGAAILLGSQLALYLSLIETKSADEKYGSQTPNRRSRTPKYSTGSDFQQSKMSVPKIQITKDSSFSDENSISHPSPYNTNQKHPPPISQPNPYQSGPISDSIGLDQQIIRNNLPQNRQNKPQTIGNRQYDNNQQTPIDSVRFFVSLYDYDPVTMSPNPDAVHEELPFRAGQTIKVFGQVDEDGFFTGETNGRRGLVPSNMVQEMDGRGPPMPGEMQGNAGKVFRPIEDSNIGYGPSNDDYRRPQGPDQPMHHQTPPSQNNFNQAPQQQQYLSKQPSYDVNPNQRRPMLTHQQSSSASNPSRNYTAHSGLMNHPGGMQRKMMTIYDYDPQTLSPNVDSEAELPFRAGEVITIYGEMDEDGFYMGESSINGRRGLVPSNFLTEFTPQMQQQPPGNQRQPPIKPVQQQVPPAPMQQQQAPGLQSAPQQQQQPMRMRDNRDRFKTNNNDANPTATSIGMNHHAPATSRNHMDYGISNGMNQQHASSTQAMNQAQPQRGGVVGVSLGPQSSMDVQKPVSSFDSSFDSGSIGGGGGGVSSMQNRNQPTNRPHTNQYVDPASSNMTMGQGMTPQTGSLQSDKPPQALAHQPQNVSRHNNETDDMPIVMDLAPPSHNQKKKKYSHSNSSSTYDSNSNYMSDSNSFQLNPDNLMNSSENLERKRSVFKNPFKKKK